MNHKLVSISTIISKCVRDLGLGSDEISHQDFIEWIAEGLAFIGEYAQFEPKTADIVIEDYKGELPCDHYQTLRILNGIYYDNQNESLLGDTEDEILFHKFTTYDFRVSFNQITTSYRNGKIKIDYLAIPTDDCGLPMIPDNPSYSTALFWKVAMHLSILGKVKNKDLNWMICEQRWLKYCGQARASSAMPDLDTMERLKNIWLSLKINTRQYNSLFATLGKPQTIDRGGSFKTF